MTKIELLQNTIQYYAWGSPDAIPELLNIENHSGQPWAELWMGAHSKAPSHLNHEGQRLSLADLIQTFPHEILGRQTAARFHNELPYLFKVLAAAKPLSIQAHPDLAQAQEGFAKENRLKIPLDAPIRNYKDANHKPECICALSRFYALYGFRAIPDILKSMSAACPAGLKDELTQLKNNPTSLGIKKFYSGLLAMNPARQKRIVDEALQNSERIDDQNAVFWIKRLAAEYPSDVSIVSPILLNLICLEPGQALYLPAGELHAYLEGLGIELMANSDNVLRGGLTAKHIDLPELLKVANFEPRPVELLKTKKLGPNENLYVTPANEFVLSSISLSRPNPYQSPTSRSVEILMCTSGAAALHDIGAGTDLAIKQGDSVLIPAAVKGYRINGDAVLYKAAVPLKE
ncbi:Mannose-6-phosphate isomerase (EC [Olavius algarvensis Delta 1 endosymbiont]|nr:Mannose-6-phosphate isomerase (EC [Olavius algarvensis Delta 1 endosymbiont]